MQFLELAALIVAQRDRDRAADRRRVHVAVTTGR